MYEPEDFELGEEVEVDMSEPRGISITIDLTFDEYDQLDRFTASCNTDVVQAAKIAVLEATKQSKLDKKPTQAIR